MVLCLYHITADEYRRRQLMPWPSGLRGTFVPKELSPPPASTLPPVPGPTLTEEIIGGGPRDFASGASKTTGLQQDLFPNRFLRRPPRGREQP